MNFYAHHYIFDIRYLLFAGDRAALRPHLDLLQGLARAPAHAAAARACSSSSLFIWIAENLGTVTRTWLYPHQVAGWSAVSLGKLGSWFLLLIISYALVAAINRPVAIKPGEP